MMEKATSAHSLVIALTYDESTERNRDAARMFQYSDIRQWLARLREAIYPAKVRFLVAGEQGDRNGRCHWHAVLFSDCDLLEVGEFRAFGREVPKENRLTHGKHVRRINWSLWPHGFAVFQEPDQGGMSYALSYALKDQFTVEKSKTAARISKAENFATGLFRMSKRPPIGEAFMQERYQRLLKTFSVPTSLDVKVPEFKGYYHPSGAQRRHMLKHIDALNVKTRFETGKDAPQWQAFLSTLTDPDRDFLNGTETEEQDDNYTSLETSAALRSGEAAARTARIEHARTCGNVLPCYDCLVSIAESELAAIGVERYLTEEGYYEHRAFDGLVSVEERQRKQLGRCNPYCLKRGSKISRETFPSSDGARLDL